MVLFAVTLAITPSQFGIVQLSPSGGVAAYAGVLAVGLGARLVAIVQAAIAARRIGAIQLAWYNRWYIYVGVYVAAVAWNTMLPLLPVSTTTSYNTPSSSMVPTLLAGDFLEARTLAFRTEPPRRGQIAFFLSPKDETTTFVARIIGLPGDRIQLKDGRLYVNDVMVERQRVEDYVDSADPMVSPVAQYQETIDGVTYRIIERSGDVGEFDNTPVIDVADGHVFVMGDNRDNSNDSRVGQGLIPISSLRDKPLFIYWSADKSRIGKVLE